MNKDSAVKTKEKQKVTYSSIKLNDILLHRDNAYTKGQNSTNIIIGGSSMYTGAPYFTALSSLRSGFDLTYIMTQKEALLSIKTLLPEAVVTEILYIEFIINRANIAIIGPGLGRIDENTNAKVIQICQKLMQNNIYIIFDGDGTHFYTQNRAAFDSYKKIIITPNKNEMTELATIVDNNIWVVEKGMSDKIHYDGCTTEIESETIPKRCGGQGDILCGIIAYLIINANREENILHCLVYACKIMRRASKLAYNVYGNSLIASDIIKHIQHAFQEFYKQN